MAIQKIAKVEAQFATLPHRTKRAHYLARHENVKKGIFYSSKGGHPAPARGAGITEGRGNGEGKLADKPGSVERTGRRPARRAIIPLDDVLPRRSSSLPGDSASSVDVPLFGLAPDGVYRAVTVTSAAVGSYPTVSPLPDLRRAIGGLLSVALSVAFTRRLWRPAVSRHPALRGPDFPRYANVTRLPGELPGAQYNGFVTVVAGRCVTIGPETDAPSATGARSSRHATRGRM